MNHQRLKTNVVCLGLGNKFWNWWFDAQRFWETLWIHLYVNKLRTIFAHVHKSFRSQVTSGFFFNTGIHLKEREREIKPHI